MKNLLKKSSVLLLALLVLLAIFSACAPQPTTQETPVTLTLATTTSVDDSGLLAYLAPYLLEDENITLVVLAQGSGQAIKTAEDGNADILIAHSPKAEEEFIASGFGLQRQQFMYNYFVIAGPKEDPAGIADAANAAEAFKRIYDAEGMAFYSRDDASGTDTKEKGLWEQAGFDPAAFDVNFYNKTGKGMLDTLIMANETDGYTLTDKSTLLANAEKLPEMSILYEKSEDLKNVYSVTLINPEKYDDLNHEAAARFHAWLTKAETQALIADYGKDVYGQALFFVD